MIVWKHKHYCKKKSVSFCLFEIVMVSLMTLPTPRLCSRSHLTWCKSRFRWEQGEFRRGEQGGTVWEGSHFFPKHRRARLSLPPNPPISLPHFILPYKLTHSSSHPPPRQAKWAEREARQVPGFRGNTPCGRNLPAPFSTPVTCALRRKSTSRKSAATHARQSRANRNRIRDTKNGQRLTSRQSSDFVRAKSGRVTYLWICVSLLIEASAALHCGHFTLMLICKTTVSHISASSPRKKRPCVENGTDGIKRTRSNSEQARANPASVCVRSTPLTEHAVEDVKGGEINGDNSGENSSHNRSRGQLADLLG